MSNDFRGTITANSTSVSIPIFFQSSTTGLGQTGIVAATTGLKVYYWRQGASPVQITITDLAAIGSAYSSGGMKETDSTNLPGIYRLDLPNATIATGVDWVVITAFTPATLLYHERFNLEDDYVTTIATKVLTLDWTTVSGEAARSTLNALRVLRNAHTTSGAIITITKEDDSTLAFTIRTTTDPLAVPIVGTDPS